VPEPIAFDLPTLALSVGAGLLTFVSPCVLPLLPAYLGYITGLSLAELQDGRAATARGRVLSRSIAFVVGLAAVFTVFGASATALGRAFLHHQTLLLQVAGALIVLFGLHLTGLVRLPFLDAERRLGLSRAPSSLGGALLMGAAFGAGWTPCIGPFLTGLLALASQERTVGQGMALLFAYGLGLGSPFVLAALAFGPAMRAQAGLKAHLGAIKLASGALVMLMGVLVLTDRISLLSGWLTAAFGTGLAH